METQKLQRDLSSIPLVQRLGFSTHANRRCPQCHSGSIYRERCEGFQKVTSKFGVRPYRCLKCDHLHYGFAY